MNEEKITFDGKYEWAGGSGAWFKSVERKNSLQIGDVRCIRGKLFKVQYKHYLDPRTIWTLDMEFCWTPVREDEHDFETDRIEMEKFRKRSVSLIFGVYVSWQTAYFGSM